MRCAVAIHFRGLHEIRHGHLPSRIFASQKRPSCGTSPASRMRSFSSSGQFCLSSSPQAFRPWAPSSLFPLVAEKRKLLSSPSKAIRREIAERGNRFPRACRPLHPIPFASLSQDEVLSRYLPSCATYPVSSMPIVHTNNLSLTTIVLKSPHAHGSTSSTLSPPSMRSSSYGKPPKM